MGVQKPELIADCGWVPPMYGTQNETVVRYWEDRALKAEAVIRQRFPHVLVEGCDIPLRDNGFGVDGAPTIRGMSLNDWKCYGCDDRGPTFTDERTGRRFCHGCVEALASWENDGCPEPEEHDYAEWIGEENVWRADVRT